MPYDAKPFDPAKRYTAPEVADRTPFTAKTLAQWRWRGIGPAYQKLHGKVLYTGDTLNAWLASGERGGKAA